jgi:hypothetical protein
MNMYFADERKRVSRLALFINCCLLCYFNITAFSELVTFQFPPISESVFFFILQYICFWLNLMICIVLLMWDYHFVPVVRLQIRRLCNEYRRSTARND